MRYKVGDRAKVKSWEELLKHGELDEYNDIRFDASVSIDDFCEDMKVFCGEEVTIRKIIATGYKIEEDDVEWTFTDFMFEGEAIEPTETIRIKYHDPDMPRLEYIGGDKSNWIDLRTAERAVMRKGDYKLISLGVSMELPKGYEAHILPRSSTLKNFGIIMGCSQGIVDESYKGDNDVWMFPALAIRDTIIEKNSRICQFRIYEHQPNIVFNEVDVLGNEDRNGIGSTGTK